MILSEIRQMPKTMTKKEVTGVLNEGMHESLFRSYHIVQKVKELVDAKTPHAVILEIIRDLER